MAETFEMLPLASANNSLKGRLLIKILSFGVECDVAPESGVARNDPPAAATFRAVDRADSTATWPTAAAWGFPTGVVAEQEYTDADVTASTRRAMGPPIERKEFIEPTARTKNPIFRPTPIARCE